ncbi:intracellular transporter [Malassezia pachydermatis]
MPVLPVLPEAAPPALDDTSLPSQPSPYARRTHAPRSSLGASTSTPFHPGSFETPTKRPTSYATSPMTRSSTGLSPSPGRKHAPIYFGPGTTSRKTYSPLRTSLSSSHSMSAIPSTRTPILARDMELTTPEKRRKLHDDTTPSHVTFASPSSLTRSASVSSPRKRAAEDEHETPTASTTAAVDRVPEVAEEPEVPVRRSTRPTRAASTMRQVLDSMQPVAPPKPAVPEVVNPYQTRSKSARPSTPSAPSTRAKALEAARQRASSVTPASTADTSTTSLLDVVERTEPVHRSPRRSQRLSTTDLTSLSPDRPGVRPLANKPKRPSPLSMGTTAADSDEHESDIPSATPLNEKPAISSSSSVASFLTVPRTKPAVSSPLATSVSTSSLTSSSPVTVPALSTAPAPALAPSVSKAEADAPTVTTPAAPAAPTTPAWCILRPPEERTAPSTATKEQKEALSVSYNDLPTYAFDISAPQAIAEPPSSVSTEATPPVPTLSTSVNTAKPAFVGSTTPAASVSAKTNESSTSTPSMSLGTAKPADATKPSFSFGSTTPVEAPKSSFSFESAKPADTSKPSFSFDTAKSTTDAPKPAFSFGTTSAKSTTETSKPGFSFGSASVPAAKPAPTFSFGATSSSSLPFGSGSSSSNEKPSSGFSFGSTGDKTSTGFSFGAVGKKPGFAFAAPSKTEPVAEETTSPATDAASSADATASSDTNALTSCGEGEEDEDTEHEARAKIWRLDSGQWQDMGVSIFRIKRAKSTGKCRVLARNAVNGNVVLNFALYEGMKVTLDKNVLTFLGFMDAKPCNLRCKVKTNEAAENLRDALVAHANAD